RGGRIEPRLDLGGGEEVLKTDAGRARGVADRAHHGRSCGLSPCAVDEHGAAFDRLYPCFARLTIMVNGPLTFWAAPARPSAPGRDPCPSRPRSATSAAGSISRIFPSARSSSTVTPAR